jgi:hypothetical protein
MLLRTAKSCGPDAPTLASSSRSCVGPTGFRQNLSADDGGKRARSPGRARHKPLKPLRAGMPGDSGVLVVTRVRSTTTSAHEAAGAVGTRHSPRPSMGAEDNCKPRAHRAARSRSRIENWSNVIASEAKQSILSLRGEMGCFAEPVIGRAFRAARNRPPPLWNPYALPTRLILNYDNALRIFRKKPGGTKKLN